MLKIQTTRRELTAVGIIWLVLMAIALGSWYWLNQNALLIIHHLQFETMPRYSKSLVLYAAGDKAAKKALEQVQEKQRGTTASVSGEYEAYRNAVDMYTQALQMDPRPKPSAAQAATYHMLGVLHESAGNDLPMYLAFTRAAIARKDIQSADAFSSAAIHQAPGEELAQQARVEAFFHTGRLDEATSALQPLLYRERTPAFAWSILGQIRLQQRNYPEAVDALTSAIAAGAPRALDDRKRLGMLLGSMGQPDKAVAVLEPGLAEGGLADGNFLHILGDQLRLAKQLEKSLEMLQKAAALEPNSGHVQLSLARTLQALGKTRRAQAALQRATALEPELQADLLNQPG